MGIFGSGGGTLGLGGTKYDPTTWGDDAADDLLGDITGEAEDLLGGGDEEDLDQGGEPDIGDQKIFAPRTLTGEIDVIKGVPIIYGRVRTNGVIVFKELVEGDLTSWFDRHNWYLVYAVAEGTTNGLQGVWIDEKYTSTYPITAGVQTLNYGSADFANYTISWKLFDGTFSGSTFGVSNWGTVDGLSWSGTADKLKGISNVHLKYTYGEELDSKDAQLAKIAFDVRGKMVRDVYDNFSSVPYRYRPTNSGTPHQYGTNPALCLLDYLTDTTFGAGIPSSDIDLYSFRVAAYYCDEVPETGVPRHSCNIELDSGQPIINNVKKLLRTCNGQLLWIAGQYVMKIDKVLSSVMSFDTSNIIGGIKINGASNSDKANQVTASFLEPANSWKMDTVSWPDKNDDSATYLRFLDTEDNGIPLRRKIALEGIASEGDMRDNSDDLVYGTGRVGYKQARYLAQQACLRSRNNLKVAFRTTAEALNLIPSDVIAITHGTPAWTAKEFIVRKVAMNRDGSVNLQASEYQAATYTWNQADAPAIVADTTLPDPSTVTVPIGLTATESIYSSIVSGGKKIRITLNWTNSDDYFVNAYDFQYRKTEIIEGSLFEHDWIEAGSTVSSSAVLNDFEKGTFDFRVRGKTATGSISEWLILYEILVEGVTEPPEDVVGFNVSNHGSNAIVSWDAPTDSTDIDHIQIGVLQEDSVLWDDAVPVAQVGVGNTTTVLPVIDGNYVAKWVNSSGLESTDYLDSGSVSVFGSELVATFSEQEAWAGTLDGFYETTDDGDDVLRFLGGSLWDTVTELMDTWGTLDELGGRTEPATYTGVKRDLGAALPMRIYTTKIFTSLVTDGSNYMDYWGKVDLRSSWDPVSQLDNLKTEVRVTQDDPAAVDATWSAYKPFLVIDVVARGVQIKVTFDQFDTNSQFTLRELSLLVDMVFRQESDRAKTATSITYSNPFYAIPDLVVTPINMATGDYMTISSEAKTGFGINFYNSSAVAQTRTYNYIARGV